MRTVAVVQARCGSSRLPGKALLSLNGRPMLDHVLERVKATDGIGYVVLATSTAVKDAALMAIAEKRGIPVWRGPEKDVLTRVADAAEWADADVVVRVTADCPFWAPEIGDEVISAFFDARTDYLSNDTSRSGYPDGTDVEVFTRQALQLAVAGATKAEDREHVTPWIRRHLKVGTVLNATGNYTHIKLSCDTPADYELARAMYEHLTPKALHLAATLAAYDLVTAPPEAQP